MRIPASGRDHLLETPRQMPACGGWSQRTTSVYTQTRSPQQQGIFLLWVAWPAGISVPMPVVKAARGKMVNHVKSLCVSTWKRNIHLTPGYWPKTVSRPWLASEEGRQGSWPRPRRKGKRTSVTSFSGWPQPIKHLAPCVALLCAQHPVPVAVVVPSVLASCLAEPLRSPRRASRCHIWDQPACIIGLDPEYVGPLAGRASSVPRACHVASGWLPVCPLGPWLRPAWPFWAWLFLFPLSAGSASQDWLLAPVPNPCFPSQLCAGGIKWSDVSFTCVMAQRAYLKWKEKAEERICKEWKVESLMFTLAVNLSIVLGLGECVP